MTHLDLAERGISRRSLVLPFTVYDTCDIKLERGATGCRSRGGTNFPVCASGRARRIRIRPRCRMNCIEIDTIVREQSGSTLKASADNCEWARGEFLLVRLCCNGWGYAR